MVKIRLLYFYM